MFGRLRRGEVSANNKPHPDLRSHDVSEQSSIYCRRNKMEEQMDKDKLLAEIRLERERFETTLARVDPQQMLLPGVIDEWTVKDLLAHITVWEQRMVSWLAEAVRDVEPQMLPAGMTWDDLDQWNEETYQEHRQRPLQDVLTEFNRSYPQAIEAVQSVSEEDLIEAERFSWREGSPLWVMVAANTFWHYSEHNETLEAWLGDLDATAP